MSKTRRDFLRAGTATLAWSMLPTHTHSANETIRLAVVGLHGRGKDHIRSFSALPNVEIIALCDVDEAVLNQVADECKAYLRQPVKQYVDYRKMLEDKEIDAISIATPNHWHALMGILACQAGKDAYVEKPCSHNLFEGRQLVAAQQKYNRIVAHGTQSRSCEALQEAIQLLRDGYLGEVYYAKGLCYKWRDTIGRTPEVPVPDGVHYDLWTGPAAEQAFSPNRFHYNWHWQWAYGNGDMGNQGVHEMDVARWGLGVEWPDVVSATGGHFMFDDDQQTPNMLVASFQFKAERKMLGFEVRHWHTNNELGEINGNDRNVVGCIFYGSEGFMTTHGFDRGYQTYLGTKREKGKGRRSGETHFQNFIDAVRSRKQEDLNAPIREGHLSAGLIHIANASHMLERTLHFDRNEERVIEDQDANTLLHGRYRAPYSVPETI
ncbi:MAG: Gfo/Idh/MocA family oxidoreductase [bacterium]|jgi:predicted dehydrogenase|nr:Gfo/Idh/MocA family oxidoreductase [bacterium]